MKTVVKGAIRLVLILVKNQMNVSVYMQKRMQLSKYLKEKINSLSEKLSGYRKSFGKFLKVGINILSGKYLNKEKVEQLEKQLSTAMEKMGEKKYEDAYKKVEDVSEKLNLQLCKITESEF